MIKVNAIKLPAAFDIYKNTAGEKAELLKSVSKINIFVGSNNSGKSRFMRTLSKQSKYFGLKESFDIEEVSSNIRQFIIDIENIAKRDNLTKVGFIEDSIKQAFSNVPTEISNIENIETIKVVFNNWTGFNSARNNFYNAEQMYSSQWIRSKAVEAVNYIQKLPSYSVEFLPEKVYIPVLRGLRPLGGSTMDLYAERTEKDYFSSKIKTADSNKDTENTLPLIFTGLTLYEQIHKLKNGEFSERISISKYEKFISENLYENKPVELIAKPKHQIVFVKIGKEKEQPIYDLGDGIQSTIILTFLPFMMKEQTFFFIEEPEMFLHPGLQRKILNFYNSLEQHTFFLTTHSNHFLDITIDIKDVSIFTFRKIFDESDEEELTPNFTIEAVDSGCESSLELLGVRNSSVFLVNATIWVEGITDRWYLREMLNSYMKYLKDRKELKLDLEEDTHYSFVEYGGANITHWSFLDKEIHPIAVEHLCAKAFVIIDKDEDKKETRKKELEEKLGKRLVILPCREVENLLPYSVIKQVVEEYEENPELKLKEYNYSQYQDIYLGRFIEDTMLKKKPSRDGGYKAESGTLKYKVKFCEKALSKIQYSELPDSTKVIIERIYKFIYEQNTNE